MLLSIVIDANLTLIEALVFGIIFYFVYRTSEWEKEKKVAGGRGVPTSAAESIETPSGPENDASTSRVTNPLLPVSRATGCESQV